MAGKSFGPKKFIRDMGNSSLLVMAPGQVANLGKSFRFSIQ